MIRIIIIVVALIAISVGGVFGMATFTPNLLPNAILNFLGVTVPVEEKEAEPIGRPSAKETVLIDIDPLQIPLFRDGTVDRSLFMHLMIEVRRGPDADLVNNNLIRIIDAFLSYVHALNALDIKPGVNDRAFLKQRLLVKAEEIVGPGIIVDLLFVNIFERPFN
ncbi:hypothetical protein OAI47_04120 [Rhodospirillaceae bacterium]|nr:hypothetical protein [Rhodospirillaceae bacterium]